MSAHEPREAAPRRGMIAWAARNAVFANLLMLLLLVGGVLMAPRVQQEVFPEFTLDLVNVQVAYPGASPSEVEQGVILAIEEAVRGLDGVKQVTATANEGIGTVSVELLTGTRSDVALADIKSAVDRITSFPQEAERPVVSLVAPRNENIQVAIYGDVDESQLRTLANQLREELLADPGITLVEIMGVRPLEVSIDVDEATLRRYGLTHDQVARVVREASIDLPAGGIRTSSGEVLLRTTERRDRADEFENIVVLARPDGTQVTLGQVAEVRDTFQETDEAAWYNGERAALLRVFRVGTQTPIEVTRRVEAFVERIEPTLPATVSIATLNDRSEIFRDRISLLLRNAYMGLILVLLVLGIFLEMKLAFWVTLGIPICFLGAFVFLPGFDASINMISLFAFILTLGIVVDDAIVVGEAVYEHRQRGLGPIDAAIAGAREVAAPVIFSVLTTMVAFLPLLFVPGVFGKFMGVIPIVVIVILTLSLVESLFVLPAHLAHSRPGFRGGLLGAVSRAQASFSRAFDRFVERAFTPIVDTMMGWRYGLLGLGLALLIVSFGWVRAGKIPFTFMPKIEGDTITATLTLPYGSPATTTEEVVQRLVDEASALIEANGGADAIGRGVFARVGAAINAGGGPGGGQIAGNGSHVGQVIVYLVPVDQRPIGAAEFARRWRESASELPGIESLTFTFSTGPSGGAAIDVQLSHTDMNVLEAAAKDVAARLATFAGVTDIEDGFPAGKPQYDVTLLPVARALGLSETEIARQLRAAFFGSEAVRQQRGRDELRVYVRRPLDERSSEYFLEQMMVRSPTGIEVPLREVARLERGVSYTSIRRENGRRIASVTADVEEEVTNANDVVASLSQSVLPDVMARYDGLSYTFAGEQREQGEVVRNLFTSMILALLVMYALMAIALSSYTQPFLILGAIPFGIVGALAGHSLMGFGLSLISLFGMIALMGVVVNDSIVLVSAVNTYRETLPVRAAVVAGSARRLRPILLTSLTTFFGLAPMILEPSVQARFLIPMAISLAFGVLFATVVTLLLVPAGYLVFHDIATLRDAAMRWIAGPPDVDPAALDRVESADAERRRDDAPYDDLSSPADASAVPS